MQAPSKPHLVLLGAPGGEGPHSSGCAAVKAALGASGEACLRLGRRLGCGERQCCRRTAYMRQHEELRHYKVKSIFSRPSKVWTGALDAVYRASVTESPRICCGTSSLGFRNCALEKP